MRRLLLFAIAFLAGACVWRGYDRVTAIHLEVLSGMVGKMANLAEEAERPTPNDVTELLYPLERVDLFLLQQRHREAEESYKRLSSLVARYRVLTSALDYARADDNRWAAARNGIEVSARHLREDIDAARTMM